MKTRHFLVQYSFEDITIWRVNNDDFIRILKTLLRTAGELQTEGPIPHVEVRELRDGETPH